MYLIPSVFTEESTFLITIPVILCLFPSAPTMRVCVCGKSHSNSTQTQGSTVVGAEESQTDCQ